MSGKRDGNPFYYRCLKLMRYIKIVLYHFIPFFKTWVQVWKYSWNTWNAWKYSSFNRKYAFYKGMEVLKLKNKMCVYCVGNHEMRLCI